MNREGSTTSGSCSFLDAEFGYFLLRFGPLLLKEDISLADELKSDACTLDSSPAEMLRLELSVN